MSAIAPALQEYFTQRLIGQRQASPHTIAAYRDCFRLLFTYLAQTGGKQPAELGFEDLDAGTISGFLAHLEQQRGVSVSTRNARLVALRSWFAFAAHRHPEHAALIARVLAIPSKRRDRPLVGFLEPEETDALLNAPDAGRWTGRRDRALLTFAVQTGLRVSELTAVRTADIALGRGAHVQVLGKGRKERAVPLSRHTVAALRPWLSERAGDPCDPVFPGPGGQHLSRDTVRKLVIKHGRAAAAAGCVSIATKKIGVHTLRHTCAMTLLRSGVDLATIALWLGHEDLRTVQIYLHADLELKERALARTTPPNATPGRYRPPDPVLAFLESL
jgi:site-specific recombinase XerD